MTIALVAFPIITVLISEGSAYFFQADEETVEAFADSSTSAYPFIEEVYVYDITTEAVTILSIEDYLTYSVLGTLQMDAEPELIKAQAVLMYTYILGRRTEEESNPTEELGGCDISTDINKYVRLAYDSDYIEKVQSAVGEVKGEYITHNGSIIVPAYCVSNGGISESALTVLGEDVPYLQSVVSNYDSEYITEISYTSDEIFARITTQDESITLLGNPSDWIVITVTTDTGYVTEITLDKDIIVTGKQLASWLNLPSARFTVSYSEEFDRFTFSVSGSGHLVGLSQYGGNKMAEEGYSYSDIISFYFTGVEIVCSE
ncbi:MAG: SpoIID/LytB domain-containing protein [Oscillospiraceae bacterium]|nr:SpoIID/LytB domain-containing protein [Oscillospiraceae bacterium]